jgi:hypothetical protein
MKLFLPAVIRSVGLSLVCFLPSLHAAGGSSEKEDVAKRYEFHQKRAEELRKSAQQCQESAQNPSCPADKTKGYEEAARTMREMAALQDQAVSALKRNDHAAYQDGAKKYKELDGRMQEIGKRMGWVKSEGKEGCSSSSPAPGGTSTCGQNQAGIKDPSECRKRAETLRKSANQCMEASKRSGCSGDMSRAWADMAGIYREMAQLNDQAADAVQKNDPEAFKTVEQKFVDLEPRKQAACERLWGKGVAKSISEHGEKRSCGSSSAPAAPSSPSSSKGGSDPASIQSEADLQRWLESGNSK